MRVTYTRGDWAAPVPVGLGDISANPEGDEQVEKVAFELRADYQGTTTVEHEDGSSEEVPTYGGGLLAVGDGDFNVGEALEEGDGVIVVYEHDQRLVDLLETYPPLKRTSVPAGVDAINPYARKTVDDLRTTASLRDIEGAGSLSRARLESVLLAHDAELAAGAAPAEAVAAARDAADGAPAPQSTGDASGSPENATPAVGELTVEQLAAVLDNDVETFEHAGAVEVPAALDELRRRARASDEESIAALAARDLTIDEEG